MQIIHHPPSVREPLPFEAPAKVAVKKPEDDLKSKTQRAQEAPFGTLLKCKKELKAAIDGARRKYYETLYIAVVIAQVYPKSAKHWHRFRTLKCFKACKGKKPPTETPNFETSLYWVLMYLFDGYGPNRRNYERAIRAKNALMNYLSRKVDAKDIPKLLNENGGITEARGVPSRPSAGRRGKQGILEVDFDDFDAFDDLIAGPNTRTITIKDAGMEGKFRKFKAIKIN